MNAADDPPIAYIERTHAWYGALGYDARPEYNKATARKCRKVGMDILVCTPERLAEAMAEIIKG